MAWLRETTQPAPEPPTAEQRLTHFMVEDWLPDTETVEVYDEADLRDPWRIIVHRHLVARGRFLKAWHAWAEEQRELTGSWPATRPRTSPPRNHRRTPWPPADTLPMKVKTYP